LASYFLLMVLTHNIMILLSSYLFYRAKMSPYFLTTALHRFVTRPLCLYRFFDVRCHFETSEKFLLIGKQRHIDTRSVRSVVIRLNCFVPIPHLATADFRFVKRLKHSKVTEEDTFSSVIRELVNPSPTEVPVGM